MVLHPAEGKGGFITVGHFALEEDGVLLRPDGFAQANAPVNRRLVAQAIELLDVDASHRVLELYSGNGNFTFRLAAHAREIVAVLPEDSTQLSALAAEYPAEHFHPAWRRNDMAGGGTRRPDVRDLQVLLELR